MLVFKGLVYAVLLLSTTAHAQTVENHSFIEATHFVDARQETRLAHRARALRAGGYETATGESVNFARWYSPERSEIQVTYLTQINRQWGILWGFGTGESAEKYTIAASLRIGFAYNVEPRRNNFFSVLASTVVGGELRERTCLADYGDIGGVREVNCRLAATSLEPEETLKFLESAKPESTIHLRYVRLF